MAYQPMNKPIPKYFNGKKVWSHKRDCKDFKPYFFNKRYCKLSEKCKKGKYYCEDPLTKTPCYYPDLAYGVRCTGISIDNWKKIIS